MVLVVTQTGLRSSQQLSHGGGEGHAAQALFPQTTPGIDSTISPCTFASVHTSAYLYILTETKY